MSDFHVDEDGELILDEHGEPIPTDVCLCFAHHEADCICGAWAWIDEEMLYEEDEDELDPYNDLRFGDEDELDY